MASNLLSDLNGNLTFDFSKTKLTVDEKQEFFRKIKKILALDYYYIEIFNTPYFGGQVMKARFRSHGRNGDFFNTVTRHFNEQKILNEFKNCCGLSIVFEYHENYFANNFRTRTLDVKIGMNKIKVNCFDRNEKKLKHEILMDKCIFINERKETKLNKKFSDVALPIYKGKNYFEDIDNNTIEIESNIEIVLDTIYNDDDIIIFNDFVYAKTNYYINAIFYINNKLVFIIAEGKFATKIEEFLKNKEYKNAYDFTIKNYEAIMKENKAYHLLESI